MEQIDSIFKGEITDWNEVRGKDGEIVCIGREEFSGTRDSDESTTGTEDASVYRQKLTIMGVSCEEIIALVFHALTDMDEELVRKVETIGAQNCSGAFPRGVRIGSTHDCQVF